MVLNLLFFSCTSHYADVVLKLFHYAAIIVSTFLVDICDVIIVSKMLTFDTSHIEKAVCLPTFAANAYGLILTLSTVRDVAAAPKPPNWGGPRPTLGAQVSLKLLFGYVTIFSSADLFTTDLNCWKKLACDIHHK